MKIFRDRHGKFWIHGSGVRLYFRLDVQIYKFYDYNKLLKGEI